MKSELQDIKDRIDTFLNDMKYSAEEALSNCEELEYELELWKDAFRCDNPELFEV